MARHPLKPKDHQHIVSLYQAGRYAELEVLARRLTARHADEGFVWQALGIALSMQGKEALFALQRTAALLPRDPQAHSNLGSALSDVGRHAEAEASCRRALALYPDYADAHTNLGRALRGLGRLEEAAVCYRRALELDPHSAETHNNLGNTLKEIGQIEEACACYEQALVLRPLYADAYNNLGKLLQQQFDQQERALACFQRALSIAPGSSDALNGIGVLLHDLNRVDEAFDYFHKALAIDPLNAEAHNNLGIVLKSSGKLTEAVLSYQRALEIKPDFAEVYNNMGNALTKAGALENALVCYERALQIKPDYFDAHSNSLFTHSYLNDFSTILQLQAAQLFNLRVQSKTNEYSHWENSAVPEKKLRIGLVSADFLSHPVGYFIEGVLTALERFQGERLEIFAYSNAWVEDELTQNLRAVCCAWRRIKGVPDAEAARLIRQDGIDILIDLSGHTAGNRLPMFAWKPAPIQVTWLGYFATTGVSAIDYLLADPWTLPECEAASFTETIWRLPQTRLCFTAPAEDIPVSLLPALSAPGVVFGCFNNLAKINDAVVALWSRVLLAVPGSRLFLKASQLQEASIIEQVRDRFACNGVPADRLLLEGSSPRREYLAAYGRVDIGLDPFPYTGGTTTAESLWMGVPVLTLAGERFLSRQGVGLLMNAGLPDWIAKDENDYVDKAIAHAADLPKLAALRAGLRAQVLASPVFDAPRFARHLEEALRGMWRQWCESKA